jgi:hypothetical protein
MNPPLWRRPRPTNNPPCNGAFRLTGGAGTGKTVGLEFLEPFGVAGFHAAVLGQPAMPRRLGDLQMPAHRVEFLTRGEEFVALSQLADDLARRVW